jgi:predicted enzyme related to lactoylglutathione lyase
VAPVQSESYTEFATAGTGAVVAGMVQAPDQWRSEGPARWAVYFAGTDTDATAATAVDLGGSVGLRPYDIPHVGRMAVLADPYGATLTVMTRSHDH